MQQENLMENTNFLQVWLQASNSQYRDWNRSFCPHSLRETRSFTLGTGFSPRCLLKPSEVPTGSPHTSASPKPPQKVLRDLHLYLLLQNTSFTSLYGNQHQLVKSKACPQWPKSTSPLRLQVRTFEGLVLLESVRRERRGGEKLLLEIPTEE